jgi:KaiC/GvpD/RAD55 family RecA-like ATPase
MNENDRERFTSPSGLSLDSVRPGTNVMVSGPSGRGARNVALRLVMASAESDDGVLLVSADVDGRALLDRAADVAGPLDRTRIGVVDCSGLDDDQQRFDEYGESIEDPGDLMRIEMELSTLYETLTGQGYDRVRLGVFSVSSLLAHADLQRVARFVHMLTGRVIATDDLGVFVVDETMQDDRTVDAIEQFCDATIDVRDGEDGAFEARVRGLDAETESWSAVTAEEPDQRRRRS